MPRAPQDFDPTGATRTERQMLKDEVAIARKNFDRGLRNQTAAALRGMRARKKKRA